MEMPPESKVMPLPTSTAVPRARGRPYSPTTKRGGRTLPELTASRPANRSFSIRFLSKDIDAEPVLLADLADGARRSSPGPRSLAGVLPRSRAQAAASAEAAASRAAAVQSRRAAAASDTTTAARSFAGTFGRLRAVAVETVVERRRAAEGRAGRRSPRSPCRRGTRRGRRRDAGPPGEARATARRSRPGDSGAFPRPTGSSSPADPARARPPSIAPGTKRDAARAGERGPRTTPATPAEGSEASRRKATRRRPERRAGPMSSRRAAWRRRLTERRRDAVWPGAARRAIRTSPDGVRDRDASVRGPPLPARARSATSTTWGTRSSSSRAIGSPPST